VIEADRILIVLEHRASHARVVVEPVTEVRIRELRGEEALRRAVDPPVGNAVSFEGLADVPRVEGRRRLRGVESRVRDRRRRIEDLADAHALAGRVAVCPEERNRLTARHRARPSAARNLAQYAAVGTNVWPTLKVS
jgi:hypothetical protein